MGWQRRKADAHAIDQLSHGEDRQQEFPRRGICWLRLARLPEGWRVRMRACMGIPPLDDYPFQAVMTGLSRLGYACERATVNHKADILVVWSPWQGSYRQSLQIVFAAEGLPVIVMENG